MWTEFKTKHFRDANQINAHWQKHPLSNYAIYMGGRAMIDIDERSGGVESFDKLIKPYLTGVSTFIVQTGSSGQSRHIHFQDSKLELISKSKVFEGIDIKAKGGYAIGPGSKHKSGGTYEVLNSGKTEKNQIKIAEMPTALMDLLVQAQTKNKERIKETLKSGGTIFEGDRNDSFASLAGSLRQKNVPYDEAKNIMLEKNKTFEPPDTESEVIGVLNSIYGRYAAGPSIEWLPRQEIPPLLTEVPALNPEMIPSAIRPWIEDEADRMQLPLEFFIGGAFVMLGSAIGRRCGIYPKQKDDWLVIPNLWGGLIAPPSVMKTPAMSAVLSPLKRLEAKGQEEFAKALREHEQASEIQQNKIELEQVALKKATKDGNSESVDSGLIRIQKIKAEIEVGQPKRKRYLINDATIEKIGELLRENPNGLLQFRDELYGLFKTLEKQGHENDRAFFLESWSGDSSYISDRIGRGHIFIPALCISMFGGIQPDKLNSYFSFILEGNTGDDGFLSRFQFLLYPDLPKSQKYTDKLPNQIARAQVNELVQRIVECDYRTLGIGVDQKQGIPAFRFSESAQEIYKGWYETFSARLLNSSEGTAFVAHLGKYRSLFPSIALIFHVVNNLATSFTPPSIGEESAKQALYWVEFLEAHARRIYGQIIRSDVYAAHAIARKIRQKKLKSGTTVREIYRNEWAGLSKPEVVRGGLDVLSQLNWLKVVTSSVHGVGAPSEVVHLHTEFTNEGAQ